MPEWTGSWSPASIAQQGIWLQSQRIDLGSVYHLPFTLTFRGPLNRAALHAAARAILARHPLLGSAVREIDGVPHVGPADHAPDIVAKDLTKIPPEHIHASLGEEIRDGILRPFDICGGPLIRMTLFVLGPTWHVLLVVPHHLVFDGQSREVFKKDLAACYRAALAGSNAEQPRTYSLADFVAEERQQVGTELPAARKYWREHWRAPRPVALPGLVGPALEADDGECVEFGLHNHIREAAVRIGVSSFEYLLASLYSLLYRYGNHAPAITFPLGRRTDDSANSIGFFAHEVPMTVPVDGNATFADFVTGLRVELRGLYRFRGVPIYRAVTGVRPDAFQSSVILNYHRHERTVDFPHLQVTAEWLPQRAARGALWIQANDEGDGLQVFLRYAPRVIDRESVEWIANHWRRLIESATGTPTTPISALPLLDPAERERLLASWSAEPVNRPPSSLLDLFTKHAAENPDKIAAVCGQRRIRYRQLGTDSDGLAQRLRCVGVGPESLVMICGEPSVDALVAQIAVIKAGAAYLPLGSSPVPRVTGASVVLGEGTGRYDDLMTVSLDDRGCVCGACAPDLPREPASAKRACVVYRSGHCDEPNWVTVELGTLSDKLVSLRKATGTGSSDTWLAQSSLSTEAATIEMLLPLIAGARVVIADRQGASDARHLLRLIRRHRVTQMLASPSVEYLLQDAEIGSSDIRIWSGYGYPETTGWSACGEARRDTTIGRPVANTRIYLLDQSGGVVPIGSPGELSVGGQALARGYAGRPALTAERFVADPYGPPGSRLYRTGDRARYRPDGQIELLKQATEPTERPDDRAHVVARRAEPGDQIQREVALILQDVLRVKSIQPQQSIFDLGVNSLAIAQIAARIRQRLKVDISIEACYEAPTVSDIAAVVADARRDW